MPSTPNNVDKDLGKIWSVLNTPFAIFFLSSIVISLGAWAYNQYLTKEKEKSQMKEQLRKAQKEFENRITMIEKVSGECSDQDIEDMNCAYHGCTDTKNYYTFNSFEEFRGQSIYSILRIIFNTSARLDIYETYSDNPIKYVMPDKNNDESDDTSLDKGINLLKQSEQYLKKLQSRKSYTKSGFESSFHFRKLSAPDSINFLHLFVFNKESQSSQGSKTIDSPAMKMDSAAAPSRALDTSRR